MSIYTALIPVRAGSRRIKNKNIQPFGDSNLLIHKIRQLKKVAEIDKIIVSTDSDEMLQMAVDELVDIRKRDTKYADDTITDPHEIISHIVSNCDGEHIMWIPCVCPLLDSKDYSSIIKKYKELVIDKQIYDSITTARLLKTYIWDKNKPLNYTLDKHLISQNLPDWYVITNGCYMASKELMLQRKYFLGTKVFLFEVNKIKSIDIDDEYDSEIARMLYDKYK